MASFIPNVTDVFPDPSLYTPDFGYMDTMLKRRQAMYQQGLSDISNKYKYISREVINPENAKTRDQFISQVKTNLKDVSALDLSRSQNVKAALDVFQPFVNNTNVLGDMALADHFNQQIDIANNYRNKDGGKEYSDYNVRYLMMQKEEFARDNPNSWQSYYGNRRYYTPYKDYSKKFLEAYEKFKPTVNTEPIIDGAYIYNRKTTSVDSAEFRKFLDSYLDEQDKKQIEIEGVVKYGNSPESLKSVYQSKYNSTVKSIDDEIKRLEAYDKLAKTKQEKDTIKANIEYYQTKKLEHSEDLNSLLTMDPVKLKASKDRIAGNLYLNEKLDEFGKSAQRKDVETTVAPNSIWTTIYTQQKLDERQRKQQMFELQKALLDSEKESKKSGKEAKDAYTGDYMVMKQSEVSGYGVAGLDNDDLQAQMGIESENTRLSGHLISLGLPGDPEAVKTFIKKYSDLSTNIVPVIDKTGKLTGYKYRDNGQLLDSKNISDFQAFQNWTQGVQPHAFTRQNVSIIKKQLESEVGKQAGTDLQALNQNLNNISRNGINFNLGNGQRFNMSIAELYNAWKTGAVKIDVGANLLTLPGMSPFFNKSITIKGKTIDLRDPQNKVLSSVIQSMIDINSSNLGQKVNKIRTDVYENSMINNATLSILDPNSEFYKAKKGAVEAITGKDVILRGVNRLTGDMMFSLKDKKLSADEFMKEFPGLKNIKYNEESGMFSVDMQGTNVLQGLTPFERSLYSSAATPAAGRKEQSGVYTLTSPPFTMPGLNYNFQWKRIAREVPGVDGTKVLDYDYYLYADNGDMPIAGVNTPIKDPLQLVTLISEMRSNPMHTIQLVEGSLK
jgi:hypothetical protein